MAAVVAELEFLQDVLSGLNVRQDNYLELETEFDDMAAEYEAEIGGLLD
jgi:acyl carrier protein phosphodiesterase